MRRKFWFLSQRSLTIMIKKTSLIFIFLFCLLRWGSKVFAFSPNEISWLQLWMDASTGLYTDAACTTQVQNDTDPVWCWKDRSVNVFTAVQSNASKKPLFISNAGLELNNKPTIRFGSGWGTNLNLGNILNLQYSGLMLFVIGKELKKNGACASPYIAKLDYNTIYPGYSLGYDSFQLLLFYKDSSRKSVMVSEFNACGNYEIVESIVERGVLNTVWRNGELRAIWGAMENIDISSSLDLTIGDYSDISSYYLIGDISEILIYNRPLTTGDRQTVEHYLNDKRFGPISYVQWINLRPWLNVLTTNYSFLPMRKTMLQAWNPYSAIFNFRNNLWRTTSNDTLETPWKFKFPVPNGIGSWNTGKIEMKVKFFNWP
jgi:hypothetical protein